jgi:hypothetical protein
VVAGLASAVSDNELTLEAWEPRAFVRLLESPTYEAWLIAWAPFGALELHDHGGSAGAIHVVRGVLVETYTDRDERYPPQTRRVDTGEDVLVCTRSGTTGPERPSASRSILRGSRP